MEEHKEGERAKYQPVPAVTSLGDDFFDVVSSASYPPYTLRFRNQRWAERVGLGELSEEAWMQHFAEFQPLPDNLPKPLALRYHGHQFRNYNPQLGDGRGFLFAQLRDSEDGRILDLGTKGTGKTPWSRGGDGCLTLKGGVREILATEMLEALGVNTSKTFSVVETTASLVRYDEPSPTRACFLVRLGHSHLRIGTFQRYAYEEREDCLKKLVEYTIENHLSFLQDEADQPLALFREVVARSASLCASWMAAGFVHGVLNTDNINILGESFDYGPYRFLPHYDPRFTAAYFDDYGLYAFGRQPSAVFWNLQQLALSLRLITEGEGLVKALEDYEPRFHEAMCRFFCQRLGVKPQGEEADDALLAAAYGFLASVKIPYDQFFFDWYGGEGSASRAKESPEAAVYQGEAFTRFRDQLQSYEATEPLRLSQPYFQSPRPCSLLIDEIEAIWKPIAEEDDWGLFYQKVDAIRERAAVFGVSL